MAVRTDSGSSSTNFTTALGGTVAAGDDLYLTEAAQTFTSGTDISANEIDSLVFGQGFTGSLTPSQQITVDLASSGDYLRLDHNGGDLRFVAGGTGSKIDTVQIISTGQGWAYFQGGELGTIEVRGGRSEVNASTTISGSVSVAGGSLLIETHASDSVSSVVVSGGNAVIRRDVTTLTVNGGSATLDEIGETITTINVNGGRYVHKGDQNPTTMTIRSGAVADFRGARAPITIGTLNFQDGAVLLQDGSFPVTITTSNGEAQAVLRSHE